MRRPLQYDASTVGENRFVPPLKPGPWTDVLSVFAGIRPQVQAAGNASTELPQRPCATQSIRLQPRTGSSASLPVKAGHVYTIQFELAGG